MSKTRHLLGVSGGKDSAALAIYLKEKYPQLEIEYYFCDTGKELVETYRFVDDLEAFLGKKIIRLKAAEGNVNSPFDFYYDLYNGYLPSKHARWCTKNMKLVPFEQFVGSDPVISYVAIRGDEDRDGYISRKSNIQSIFPFRHNIWSEDVIGKVLKNSNIPLLLELAGKNSGSVEIFDTVERMIQKETHPGYTHRQKLKDLLAFGAVEFNKVVFEFLKGTDYPLSKAGSFPLLENEDVLARSDIFNILEQSGVGIPRYYREIEFEINGRKGVYARSRSGCFFCFFQRKIEWVWLYEQHPGLFREAMKYEKSGFTWLDNETLEEFSRPERLNRVKEDYVERCSNAEAGRSPYLIDILEIAENEGCAACFL
ncbi:MAG: phosphoadenosine phosphosulfate reductase family protein [Candidatus Aminicenantes bacterium]|nr:phosphoadenosine phosphosulfate reductase family protein [Candidatus Aminicenantes bacterium]